MLLEISGEKAAVRMMRQRQSKNNTQLWMGLIIEAILDAVRAICIGTWNVRSMNQGTLEVVKQEMARVNIDILGISELKWTGMDEFNSGNHYIRKRQWHPTPVLLPGKSHGWRTLVGCSPWGRTESDTTEAT